MRLLSSMISTPVLALRLSTGSLKLFYPVKLLQIHTSF